ncbi:Lrp/AsnC family transcriptional regulator [Thermoactinomyces mirandus]|uniref:Lrp/AsnC family transcriptional regulator n=1 Tax=Thermoactinomyces mirandus TaxID=2756294 RepID=A0A7W2AS08_9BACL|nr:Lrp/AsnC family transcriptional regulator [Thermoactinomyces mirandus]MBA4602195.1 Lrp/AsnC family transcriptional regulator [Thermoactinomyces mirandus]
MNCSLQQEVLSLLNENAKLSADKIAIMLGESKDTIETLISELEETGTLLKYKAVVNWQKAGIQKVSALIDVKVTPQQGFGFDALARRIYQFPEVRSVYLMSGAYDLSVAIEVDTLESVGRFVSQKLAPLDSVVGTTTHFVMKKYKEDGIILDDPEQDQRLVITP